MKHVETGGGKSVVFPPHTRGIVTNDPGKIVQAFGNASFRIKSGEMGTCYGGKISTKSSRNQPHHA
ncbi:hypothetical protein L0665_06830 [Methanogenium marinum]|uniref:Uncharacterized protein n=1 Tax=Methanogenium marinum TaxID=348610 RepID=A0A9Q4PYA9_9EURY|nr:hypothetical protein [Methanogenium marinum]MDE4908323.1 hypothetical protein [Methanogenium marinum]